MGDFFSIAAEPGGMFQHLSGATGIKADAKSRQNVANFNAQVALNEKRSIEQAGKFKSKRLAEASSRKISSLETKIAAAGGTGSPVSGDIIAEQKSEDELDMLLASFESSTKATQQGNIASLTAKKGKIAKRRGDIQATKANVDFGKTLLSGFA